MTVIPRVYGIQFFLGDCGTGLVMEVGDRNVVSPKEILISGGLIVLNRSIPGQESHQRLLT